MSPKIVDGGPDTKSQSVQPILLGSCDAQPPRGYQVGERENVIRDQILVTGPEEQVTQLAGLLFGGIAASDAAQASIEEISLDFRARLEADGLTAESGEEPVGPPRFASAAPRTLITRVYPLPEGMDLETALETAYVLAEGLEQPVFAEPNYLIGGSSGCIEGGPAGHGHPATGERMFWDQWAFGPKGIKGAEAMIDEIGDRQVRVAVFDTSPFAVAGKWHIPWLKKTPLPLNICVWHPEPGLDPAPATRDPMSGYYLDHGLFVSGMIHAVAPQSEIHLIRVLNEHNLGDVPTLTKALIEFLQWDYVRRGGTLQGTVLNLSLGQVEEPDDNGTLLSRVLERLRNRPDSKSIQDRFSSILEFPVASLEAVLHTAHQAGAIIVACSGNRSDSSTVQPADAPACYDFVIGVAGHGEHLRRSCFSNSGDIAAPAGDLARGERMPGKKPKQVKKEDWLVGLSRYSGEEQGYMFWRGTSFAAPMVSGAAARLLLQGTAPHLVRDEIEGDAAPTPDNHLGKGRLKVKHGVLYVPDAQA